MHIRSLYHNIMRLYYGIKWIKLVMYRLIHNEIKHLQVLPLLAWQAFARVKPKHLIEIRIYKYKLFTLQYKLLIFIYTQEGEV